MSRAWPWSLLGLTNKALPADIRKAYADKLRAMNPDDDPAAFANLRQARDHALRLAKERVAREEARVQAAERGDAAPLEAEEDEAAGVDLSDDGWYDPDDFDEPPVALSGGEFRIGPAIEPVDAVINQAPISPISLPDHLEPGDDIVVNPSAIEIDNFTVTQSNPEIRISGTSDGNAEPLLPANPVIGPPVLGDDNPATDSVDARGVDDRTADRVAVRYALEDLLYTGKRNDPLDVTEARRLLAIIVADPALDRIADQLATEHYLAQIVAQTLPRSAPLVRPLADHFGWRAEAKTINQSGTIGLLADHALAQDFRERIERPDNKGFRAWQALTTPGQVAWYARRPPYLTELMQVIREQHPLLEQDYDPQRFDYWVHRLGKSDREGGSNFGVGLILAIVFLFTIFGGRILGEFAPPYGETDREQITRVQLEEFDDPIRRRNTIDDVLRAVGGSDLHISAMEAHDSAFIRQMDERLLRAKGRLARLEQAEPLLAQILMQRIRGGLEDALQADLVGYRTAQAMLAEARLARDGSVAACSDIMAGTPRNLPDLPLQLRQAWQAGQRRMLLGSRALAADLPRAQEFRLLTTTWGDAARRGDMTESEFFASFRGDRGDTAYCRAYVALLRTALARPSDPDRLDVLRRL